jgi:hypothetical protein
MQFKREKMSEITEFDSTSFNYDILSGRFLMQDMPEIKSKLIRVYLCAPYTGLYFRIISSYEWS